MKWIVADLFFLTVILSSGRADIAVLRPVGPKTGSGFSTPGRIYNEAQAVPVAMAKARVAMVDDARPPLARREFRWGAGKPHFTEEMLQARLDGRFALPPVDPDPPIARSRPTYPGHGTGNTGAWILYGEREERAAFSEQDFLWTQKITPGARQKVLVRYTLALRAPRLAYPEMGYDKLWTVEPEHVAKRDRSRRYFFFDYVLRSGATWEGPIGRETITLTAELGVNPGGLVSFGRKARREGAAWVWEIVNEDPTEDVLVALPL